MKNNILKLLVLTTLLLAVLLSGCSAGKGNSTPPVYTMLNEAADMCEERMNMLLDMVDFSMKELSTTSNSDMHAKIAQIARCDVSTIKQLETEFPDVYAPERIRSLLTNYPHQGAESIISTIFIKSKKQQALETKLEECKTTIYELDAGFENLDLCIEYYEVLVECKGYICASNIKNGLTPLKKEYDQYKMDFLSYRAKLK